MSASVLDKTNDVCIRKTGNQCSATNINMYPKITVIYSNKPIKHVITDQFKPFSIRHLLLNFLMPQIYLHPKIWQFYNQNTHKIKGIFLFYTVVHFRANEYLPKLSPSLCGKITFRRHTQNPNGFMTTPFFFV